MVKCETREVLKQKEKKHLGHVIFKLLLLIFCWCCCCCCRASSYANAEVGFDGPLMHV